MTRSALAALAAVALCSACESGPVLSQTPLETLSGAMAAPLSECPTEKCLTVVVVPWSGVCQAIAPHVVALRDHLAAKGVTTRVVVARAPLDKLKPFAQVYGPDAQLDPDGAAVPTDDGVPLFVVTDREGRRLKRVVGFPSGATTPESLSAAFLLP